MNFIQKNQFQKINGQYHYETKYQRFNLFFNTSWSINMGWMDDSLSIGAFYLAILKEGEGNEEI